MSAETTLAAAVVAWLEAQGWDVYQEVQPSRWAAGVADIVAAMPPIVWVVECKTRFSLDVMAQAYAWRHMAHLVSIAVPVGGGKRHGSFSRRVLSDYGLGLIEVDARLGQSTHIYQRVTPALHRGAKRVDVMRKALIPERKTFAPAGNNYGARWTPFQQTCRAVREVVAERPGLTLKELVDGIEHHYANDKSAISSLKHWLDGGKVEGVRIVYEGRAVRVYPAKEAA